MRSYKLVMPGDLNHYGFLFGGKMLMWVDEVAWMAVSGEYPGCNFVTVGMSDVAFHKSVHPKSVLRFETERQRVGRTSVTYRVEVFRRHIASSEETSVFTTEITFVRVDADGGKLPIPTGEGWSMQGCGGPDGPARAFPDASVAECATDGGTPCPAPAGASANGSGENAR